VMFRLKEASRNIQSLNILSLYPHGNNPKSFVNLYRTLCKKAV